MDSRLPQLFVIGAAKGGTTALFYYLRQHTQLYLPAHEEPSFFAFEGKTFEFAGPEGVYVADNNYPMTSLGEYQALYEAAPAGAMAVDVSPAYLYWPGSAERIRRYAPHAKLCAILRHPADRAYSGFLHARREGREPLEDFEAALKAEPERIAANWGLLWRYADQGFYATQLQRYYDVFPREQISVFLHDDLVRDPRGVCAQIFAFAGLEDASDAIDTNVRANVSGMPRSGVVKKVLSDRSGPVLTAGRALKAVLSEERLRRLKMQLKARNTKPPAPIDPVVRARLTARFADDVTRLEELIGRDLGAWRAEHPPGLSVPAVRAGEG